MVDKTNETPGETKPEPLAKPKKPKIPRQPMPEQAPEDRAHNFDEVPRGYTPETAILEASRCLNCKKPGCVGGCPVNVDIPGFISLVQQGKFIEAAH